MNRSVALAMRIEQRRAEKIEDECALPMTLVSITADGDAYDGPLWWIEGQEGYDSIGFRIIQVSDT